MVVSSLASGGAVVPDQPRAGNTDTHFDTGTGAAAGAYAGPGAERIMRRGSDHKRLSITRAALGLFLSDGYARVSIDNIAAEACVSKRTLYDYFGDKERLFLSVIEEAQDALRRQFIEVVDRNLTGVQDIQDVRAALVAFGRELAPGVARSQQHAAVIRLLISESPHFPALLERWSRPQREYQALAERLALLHERGILDITEPEEAACHLGSLIIGRLNNRSLFGRLPLDDAEIDRVVVGGVEVFLRAYRAR